MTSHDYDAYCDATDDGYLADSAELERARQENAEREETIRRELDEWHREHGYDRISEADLLAMWEEECFRAGRDPFGDDEWPADVVDIIDWSEMPGWAA